MERKKTGLTVIELLIVLGIISLLVGLLLPALSSVKNMARETKQKAQFSTIELALAAFKNDYGDYPPSDSYSWLSDNQEAQNYCGAQKLTESLLGWDLLGFHPDSAWRADGTNRRPYRDPVDPSLLHPPGQYFLYNPDSPIDMDKRKGPYLELATVSAFKLGDLFSSGLLAPNTYVMCDVFGWKKVVLPNGKTTKAGAPILYYRANTTQKLIGDIYNVLDNNALVLMKLEMDRKVHPLASADNQYGFFYDYIRDPKIEARPWPYRPDSYLLISAGVDGLYGTSDDITNFGD